ncbi:MAG: hypothetical protein ACE367_19945, partial [Acidimicrobiales bacterium]
TPEHHHDQRLPRPPIGGFRLRAAPVGLGVIPKSQIVRQLRFAGFESARDESPGVTGIDLASVVRISPEDEWPRERLIEELGAPR